MFAAWVLALASATNLLYHFPPLMAVVGQLAGDSRWTAEAVINHRDQMELARRPEILALWIHFTLASIAVAAIFALWPAKLRGAAAATSSADDGMGLRGLAGIALAASALQLPVGGWVLATSSVATRDSLLGNDPAASACFLGGIVAALALLQALAAIAMGDLTASLRRRAAWLLVVIAVLMSATLSLGRAADGARHRPQAAAYSFFSGSLLASSNVPPGNVPAFNSSS
jgi:hypothetical protein